MPKNNTYSSFLSDFRTLVREGEAAKLQRMFLLVEMKSLEAVWRTGPHNSWISLLEKERLCPVAYYHDFEKACETFKKSVIDKIGADAAVVLARVEPSLHDSVLKRIYAHIDTLKVPPSRQLIWSYVRSMRAIPVPNLNGKVKRSYARH